MINRRDWLKRIAGGVLAGGMRLRRGSAASLPFERPAPLENPAGGCPLALKDYQPKSMLHTVETPVSRARFPVTDVHTHLSFVAGHKNGVFPSASESACGLNPTTRFERWIGRTSASWSISPEA